MVNQNNSIASRTMGHENDDPKMLIKNFRGMSQDNRQNININAELSNEQVQRNGEDGNNDEKRAPLKIKKKIKRKPS